MSTVIELQTRLKKIEDDIRDLTFNKAGKSYLRDNGIIVGNNNLKLNYENVTIGQPTQYLQVDSNGFRYVSDEGVITNTIFNFIKGQSNKLIVDGDIDCDDIKSNTILTRFVTATDPITSLTPSNTLVTKAYVDSVNQINLLYNNTFNRWEDSSGNPPNTTTNGTVFLLSINGFSGDFDIPSDISSGEYGKVITIVNQSSAPVSFTSGGSQSRVLTYDGTLSSGSINSNSFIRFMAFGGGVQPVWRNVVNMF